MILNLQLNLESTQIQKIFYGFKNWPTYEPSKLDTMSEVSCANNSNEISHNNISTNEKSNNISLDKSKSHPKNWPKLTCFLDLKFGIRMNGKWKFMMIDYSWKIFRLSMCQSLDMGGSKGRYYNNKRHVWCCTCIETK